METGTEGTAGQANNPQASAQVPPAGTRLRRRNLVEGNASLAHCRKSKNSRLINRTLTDRLTA